MDQRSTRDGRSIEEIGFYDPLHNEERLKMDRYEHWLGCGAQPSKTVADIARRIKDGVTAKPADEKSEKVEETVAQPDESAEETEAVETEAVEQPEKADDDSADAEKDSE
jgi:small subunit ribosomal protein S16